MDDRKFICYWDSEPEVMELQGFDFFIRDNGYRPNDIELIDDLIRGESIDLSDGIAQTHYILRVN